mgnify:CR=1 FL=1
MKAWRACFIGMLALLFAGISISPLRAAEASVRFATVDVFVDSTNRPLAAYQIEIKAADPSVKIVGIEGGAHPAFSRPPFYDPRAMQADRVILAAFSTNSINQLPVGRTRVATIHVQASQAAADLNFEIRLRAAAGPDGKRMNLEVAVEERKSK